MHELLDFIKKDMRPALGVTEPGAIAFIMATAKSYIKGELVSAELFLNSGMYKNAFSCGIPNSLYTGNMYSAALGLVAGNPELKLESLSNLTVEDNTKADELVKSGKISVYLDHISSRIFLRSIVKSANDECEVIIQDEHTNICYIRLNDKILLDRRSSVQLDDSQSSPCIHKYNLSDIVNFADSIPDEELEFISEAYKMNLSLLDEGLNSSRTTIKSYLLKRNGDKIISKDERTTAQLLCNAAIEARVLGLSRPAMSITGSGAHGIICTLPIYAVCKAEHLPDQKLFRATTISYLITQYIKEYSGKLSAFCGCGIAAGTGVACAIAWLKGGNKDTLQMVIQNMAAGITGMICDGGNQGCAMKGIVAVDAAFSSVEMALMGIYISDVHGICGKTAEETMKNMGLIASPGMVKTEDIIVQIMKNK